MKPEISRDEGISIGEPVGSLTSDKIELERITVPNGPWVWRLVVVEEGGSRAGALLTTVDLQSLRDLFSRAVVWEQGGVALPFREEAPTNG
jgi:hypothetical protein